jgi:hypothetical protein
VGQDSVVVFDFASGKFLRVTTELHRLNGQAVLLLPLRADRTEQQVVDDVAAPQQIYLR